MFISKLNNAPLVTTEPNNISFVTKTARHADPDLEDKIVEIYVSNKNNNGIDKVKGFNPRPSVNGPLTISWDDINVEYTITDASFEKEYIVEAIGGSVRIEFGSPMSEPKIFYTPPTEFIGKSGFIINGHKYPINVIEYQIFQPRIIFPNEFPGTISPYDQTFVADCPGLLNQEDNQYHYYEFTFYFDDVILRRIGGYGTPTRSDDIRYFADWYGWLPSNAIIHVDVTFYYQYDIPPLSRLKRSRKYAFSTNEIPV